MPLIIVPVPLMALALGFVGGYAAEKFIKHVEPKLDSEIKRMQVRRIERQIAKARAQEECATA